MAKFSFRLQRVLEYREMEEEWAKQALLSAQRARADKEAEIQDLLNRRTAVVSLPADRLDQRLHLERVMERIDDEEREHRMVLSVLESDVLEAQNEWHSRRQAVEALKRLREEAHREWLAEEERKEQAALDEWTTMRRAA